MKGRFCDLVCTVHHDSFFLCRFLSFAKAEFMGEDGGNTGKQRVRNYVMPSGHMVLR